MEVQIKIMGKTLSVEDIGLKTNIICSVQDLEKIIISVNKARIFSGCAEINSTENVITSFTFRDKEAHLRHKSCPLLLENSEENNCNNINSKSDKCKFCTRAKHTLNKKKYVFRKEKRIQFST